MEPTQELIDRLRMDKIEAARRMSEEQRLLAGAELFEFACGVAMAGIRMQNPDISDSDARAELHRRLWLRDRQELDHERR